ncbi:succinyl-CoA ligase, alpha subunit, partial [Kipferlia bialata]
AVKQTTESGLGQSTVIGIGGDPIRGTGFIDVLEKFANDPQTAAVVMIGEIGSNDEQMAAEWISKNLRHKPVVSFIAGASAPPGKTMGHAGALIGGGDDTADAKYEALENAGVHTTRIPTEIGELVAAELLKHNMKLKNLL